MGRTRCGNRDESAQVGFCIHSCPILPSFTLFPALFSRPSPSSLPCSPFPSLSSLPCFLFPPPLPFLPLLPCPIFPSLILFPALFSLAS